MEMSLLSPIEISGYHSAMGLVGVKVLVELGDGPLGLDEAAVLLGVGGGSFCTSWRSLGVQHASAALAQGRDDGEAADGVVSAKH